MLRLFLLANLFFFANLFSEAAEAQIDKETYNLVKIEITVDNKTIAKPEIVMQLGSSAISEFLDPNGYSLKVDLKPSDALGRGGRTLSYEIYFPERDRWILLARPTLQTLLGQNLIINFTSKDGKKVKFTTTVEDNFKPASDVKFGNNRCTMTKIVAWKKSMAEPISFEMKKAALQQGPGPQCCELCRGYRCCSDGQVCCSDPYLCAGRSCCTH